MGDKQLKINDIIGRDFAKKISSDIDINNYISDLLKWLEKPTSGLEPYGAFIRIAMGVGKNGYDSDPQKWLSLLNKIEQITAIVDKNGSCFAKTILHESIAHRYADLFLLDKSVEYEQKMLDHYSLANKYALDGEYYKNVDSSFYWLAVAYHRAGEWKKARYYYCRIAKREGHRFTRSKFFIRKIELSKRYCREKNMPEYIDYSLLKIKGSLAN